jgi:hypothetical protein
VTNTVEVAVFAQRRSGHHAIVNWLVSNFERDVVFLNENHIRTNPFLTEKGGWYDRGDHNVRAGTERWRGEADGRLSRKDLLMYNFEDHSLAWLPVRWSPLKRLAWVGRSDRFHRVLVIRDPFNSLASRLRWMDDLPGARAAAQRWKEYARAYLEAEARGFIAIDYDRWFLSRPYREGIADQFGWPRQKEDSLRHVARFGPNTKADKSFDGLGHDERAQEMKVLERWQAYAEHDGYRSLFRDPELKMLVRRVYGDIPALEPAFRALL